jgi:hypothetical protein
VTSVVRVIAPALVWTTVACSAGLQSFSAPRADNRPSARQHRDAVVSPRALGRPDATKAAADLERGIESLARAPLAFEAIDDRPDVFVSRTPRYILRVAPTWAELDPFTPPAMSAATRDAAAPTRSTRDSDRDRAADAAGTSIRMHLVGASTQTHAVPQDALPGTTTYLLGNDPSAWRTNVATYARVRYDAIYPGIDIVYYGSQREIEYDFVVAPGARPDPIALGFEGVAAVAIRDNGDLALTRDTENGDPIVLRAPRASQTIDGRVVPVDVRYRMTGPQRVGFMVAAYDRTRPLVIDPILSYATSLGGGDQDEGNAVAVDAAGNVFVAGFTRSTNFPASGSPAGHFDLFVTKLDSTGSVVLSSTYVGGSGPDEARGLAIDADGNAYLTGVTRSTNFPTKNPLQAALSGESDAFVVKLSTTGAGLVFSTYWGGTDLDEGTGIAIDNARNVYVTGVTRSTDFPTASPRQAAAAGQLDAFVTKLTPSGGGPSYSSYLGGSGSDQAHAIAADPSGNVTVVGTTSSTNFPLASPYQDTVKGPFDAFISRMNTSGNFVFSTLLGGSGIDAAQSVTVNSDGWPAFTGSTTSTDFPVLSGAPQGTSGGGLDAFVTVMSSAGVPYTSTYLGGAGSDRGRAIAFDPFGRLYVVGQTFSADFPTSRPVQAKIGGNRDTFVTMLEAPYAAFTYSTYLGGSNNDDGLGVAADRQGRAYVTGAMMFAWPDLAGESDAFVMRVSSGAVGDLDSDGMPDGWESDYNLDPEHNDAAADPDGDGLTNLQEYQNGTHPTGFFTRYLAEGSTGDFFKTQLALFNPATQTAIVLLRFQQEGASEITRLISLPAHARYTLDVATVPGLEGAAFSTVIEADLDVVADRTMTWDGTGFGSHAETALPELSTVWYLAEGATHGAFDLYYLLQNPNNGPAKVTITYLRPAPQAPIEKTYDVPGRSRVTIHVDDVTSGAERLRETDVSATIKSDLPIVVERAMYMTVAGRLFSAGHESAGVTAPSTTWFFAEGATGVFFDMYLLLANPGTNPAEVTLKYLLADGNTITRMKTVPGQSRLTVNVDGEGPELADAAVSTTVTSTVPIIAERAMWWPSPNWIEAHNSAGAVVTSSRWAVAEGEVGGTRATETYVLIANTSAQDAMVKVSVFYEDQGIVEPRFYTVKATSRFNVDMHGEFPQSVGRRFSTLVEALGDTPAELVVERAMYSNSGKTIWAAGTNALGTPLFAADTFVLTPGGVFPKRMVVQDGTRVRVVNKDTVSHRIESNTHPENDECPRINDLGVLQPGESKLTGNMVIELGINACGFHDEQAGTTFNFTNMAMWGRIIIKP